MRIDRLSNKQCTLHITSLGDLKMGGNKHVNRIDHALLICILFFVCPEVTRRSEQGPPSFPEIAERSRTLSAQPALCNSRACAAEVIALTIERHEPGAGGHLSLFNTKLWIYRNNSPSAGLSSSLNLNLRS